MFCYVASTVLQKLTVEDVRFGDDVGEPSVVFVLVEELQEQQKKN